MAGFKDFVEDEFNICDDLFISKSNHAITETFDFFGSQGIFFNLIVVNVAIDLDNEFAYWTVEVRNEPAHRSLSTEFETAQAPVA